MNKNISLTNIIAFLVLTVLLLGGAYLIHIKTKDMGKFCSESYKNDSFMESFVGDNPITLKDCCLDFKGSYCNKFVDDDYEKCVILNGTLEQRKFMKECGYFNVNHLTMVLNTFLVCFWLFILYFMFHKEEITDE